MNDPRDGFDPARNFTRSENQPLGARIPEYVIRQLIGFRLAAIAADADRPQSVIDELFAFWGPETIKQVKSFLREHPNIQVVVNWPREDQHLPYVAVVNQGEQEDSELSFLGDATGVARYGAVGVDGRQSIREQRGFGMRCNLDVIIATQDPVLTMVIHYLVKYVILTAKLLLEEHYDIHNLTVSGRDLSFDERMFPTFGYFKSVSLNFQTIFDFNLSEHAAQIVDVGLLVDALKDGQPHLTRIPEDE